MNPTISIGPNQWCNFPITGLASDGVTPEPIHGSLMVSDYTKAYVSYASGLGALVPKIEAPQGGSFTVSAILNATDAATGAPLPQVQLDVIVNGPPDPDQLAVSASIGPATLQQPIDTLHGTPSDPGSATVTF